MTLRETSLPHRNTGSDYSEKPARFATDNFVFPGRLTRRDGTSGENSVQSADVRPGWDGSKNGILRVPAGPTRRAVASRTVSPSRPQSRSSKSVDGFDVRSVRLTRKEECRRYGAARLEFPTSVSSRGEPSGTPWLKLGACKHSRPGFAPGVNEPYDRPPDTIRVRPCHESTRS
jgi:hypothetical protein